MKRTPLQRHTSLKRSSPLLNSTEPKLKRSGRKPPRATFAASPEQREKVAGMPCLSCGREEAEWLAIDPAHVVPRSLGGCDHEDCVVPLCRTSDGTGCHRAYDLDELDLLPLLEPSHREEQAHAVMHLGIAGAFRRVTNDRKATA